MKECIVIILIALHLISSNLYAVNRHDAHINNTLVHKHHHSHNTSNHKHSHSHVHTILLDFFVHPENADIFNISDQNEKYSETTSQILNPITNSLFRPPKI